MEGFQAVAKRFINTTKNHLFLTGKAGTGKTTFLKNLKSYTHKSYIVVAPTGIAALNAGGVTIHSQFLLPPGTFLPGENSSFNSSSSSQFVYTQSILARKHPLNSIRKQVLRSIDLLVIDEVSMLRADLLDAIDYRMRSLRGNFHESFGGVQVLFIGDLYQLPPVVKRDEESLLGEYYNSPWFYEARALQQSKLIFIELDKIFRQQDDGFITLLNNLRNNTVTDADIELLNRHYKSEDEISKIDEVITLTTHNYKADDLNLRALRQLSSKSHFFSADVEGEFPEGMYPVSPNIELKTGTQVMFVRNDPEGQYYNGKLATVAEINGSDIWVEMAGSHERYKLKKHRWENKKYSLDESQDMSEDVVGTFEQYPVKLAWAITVHKSQGLTFEKAIIDVGEAFADGQVYVALSRLTSLNGLILRTKVRPSSISTDKNVAGFVSERNHPSQLEEQISKGQLEYVQHLLDSTFDFTGIVRELRYVIRDNKEGVHKEHVELLNAICTQVEDERENTQKFRRQLNALFHNDKQLLRERITKGSDYYKRVLFEKLRHLLRHQEEIKKVKRAKTYLNQLGELDVSFMKKIKEIEKALSIVETVLTGNELTPESFDTSELAAKRQSVIDEIRTEVSAQEPKPAKKKRGKKKKDGDERSTYDITLDMFKGGMPVAAIAKERELAISTIEGHLAKAVELHAVDLSALMDEESILEVVAAIELRSNQATFSELYHQLGRKYSHGLIRAVWSDYNFRKAGAAIDSFDHEGKT